MSENNHKEWAPGLVALYRANGLGSGALDFAIRTAGNARQWVAKDGRWHSEGSDDWGAFAWYWPEEPVWVGSRETYREMRAAATDPADLWRIVCGTVEIPETAPNRADSTVVIFGEEYVKASDSQEALAQAEATIVRLRRDLRDAEENSNTWCDRFDYEREQMDCIRAALGGRFAGESTSGMVAEIERLREEIKTHRHAAADAQMRRDDSIEACKRAPRVAHCLADIEPGIYVSANGDIWRSDQKGTIRYNLGGTKCVLWTTSDDRDPVRANGPFTRIG